MDDIAHRLKGRRLAVFLDYDGTLAPIAPRPEQAHLPEATRTALRALAERCPVIIISGRDRSDVARLVGLDNLIYAGSHGFDIAGSAERPLRHRRAPCYAADLRAAAREVRDAVAGIDGVLIEPKTAAVAVHYRLAPPRAAARVRTAVAEVAARHPRLRVTGGKKVWELRPAVEWDKGKALLWVLEALGLDRPDVVPIYIGDDETDEDAFAALHGRGLSFVVAPRPLATGADYRLRDPDEVRWFLEALCALIDT
ncbi:MAG: trehalose-phosphatase, partial [Alphaproteobacteria bacterium]